MKWLIPFGILAFFGLIGFAMQVYRYTEPFVITTYSMGSAVQQTLYGPGASEAALAVSEGVNRLEHLISYKIEDSDIRKLNQNAGGSFEWINAPTYQLLQLATDVYEISGGAFDISIAPVSQLWDFDSERKIIPDAALIESLLRYVDGSTVKLLPDGTAALRDEGAAIELGAIGKGAACDAAVSIYETEDISCGIVAVGGSVGVYGKKLWNQPWKVAVRDPNTAGSMGELSIEEGFLSTSGDYEKAFEADGVRYHHLLDPKTGYPVHSGLRSVTVWSTGGALSDALSTAAFVLGPQESRAVLETYGAEAIFITDDNEVLVTDGLSDRFTLTSDDYHLREQ